MSTSRVEAILTARDASFSSVFRRAEGTVNRFSHKVGAVVSRGMKIAGAAVAAFGVYSIKAGAGFEAGMSEVAAISGATAADMAKLEAKAEEMGAKTKFSATESAEALKYMAMAGWDTESMLDGLNGVMTLAAASGEELGMVSDIVTDGLTAFGQSADQAGRFADILAAASSKSNTNVQMLGESFKYAAPVAGALGFSMEDTSVALGLMANAGIKASQAGTTLRTALTNMTSPGSEAAGMMEKLGISVTDSEGNMKSLETVMRDLRGSFAGLSEEQKVQAATAIFGRNAMAGMLAIINAGEDDFNGLTEAINGSEGAAQKMSETMMDNLKGDFTLLKSAVEGLGTAFYKSQDILRPVVQTATKWVNGLTEVVKALNGEGMTTAERIGLIREKLQPLAPAFAVVTSAAAAAFALPGLMAASKGIAAFGGHIGKLHPLLGALPNLFSTAFAVMGPAAIGGIVLAGAGLIYTTFKDKIDGTLDVIKEKGPQIVTKLVSSITEKLPELMTAGANLVLKLSEAIGANLGPIVEGAGKIIASLVNGLVANMPKIFEGAMNLIRGLVTGLINAIPLLLESAGNLVGSLIEGFITHLPEIVKLGWELIKALALGILKAIPNLLSKAWEGIKKGFSNVWNWITGKSKEAADDVVDNSKAIEEELQSSALRLNESTEEQMSLYATTVKDKTSEAALAAAENSAQMANDVSLDVSSMAADVTADMSLLQSNASSEVETLAQNATSGFEQIHQSATTNLSGVEQVGSGSFDALAKSADRDFSGVAKGATSNFSSVEAEASKKLGAASSTGIKALAELSKGSAVETDKMAKSVSANMQKVQDTMSKGISVSANTMDKSWAKIATGASSAMDKVTQATSKAMEQMQAQVRKGTTAIVSAFSSFGQNVGTSNTKFLTDLTSAFEKALRKIKDVNTKSLRRIEQDTRQSQQRQMQDARRFGQESMRQAQSITKSLANIYRNLANSMVSIGQNVGYGFNNGLASTAGAIYATAQTIANNVATTMAKALQERSPSRKTRKVGINAGKGLEQGLLSSERAVANAADVLAGAALPGLGDISTRVSQPSRGEYLATPSEAQNARPAEIRLMMGGREWRAFVGDVTRGQDAQLELVEVYGV